MTLKTCYLALALVLLTASASGQSGNTINDDLTDRQKQLEIQNMVNNHKGALPVELVLAIIRQEGGEGAFHIDGWNYNRFYSQSDGPWAQPTNGDGIMQVANTDYHEKSGPYTNDQNGYDNAINDGCNYLLWHYNAYDSYVQSVLYYNAGRGSLYTYLGKNWGDRNYLSNVATHLSNFVPNTYGLQDQNLVESLNQGQSILDDYLYNKGIKTGQSIDYYSQYQVQLDNELHNALDSAQKKSIWATRTPQIGDHVSIYSGYYSATFEGTITDIGNGLICIRESGKDWEGNDIEFNRCIGIESIRTLGGDRLSG